MPKGPTFAGFARVRGDESNPSFALILEEGSRAIHVIEAGDSDTDWNVAADTHPSIYIHSATTPATEYIVIRHDATDAHINVVGANLDIDVPTGAQVAIQVNDTDEFTFDATAFTVASGNFIDFNAAAGSYANLIRDVNNLEILDTQAVASAVVQIGISNAATGNPAIVTARGETNSNLQLDTTGTGQITIALGGDEVLRLHDASGMTFSAAADTAGHAGYVQTEDGGAASGNNNGVAGGLLDIRTGDGTAPAGTGTTGGAGGASSFNTGAGAAGSATGTGGAGGVLTIAAGAGGNTSGAGTGGRGADLVLDAGAGGTTTGGTNANAGIVRVADRMTELLSLANITTAGDVTYTAAQIAGGVITRDPNGGARTDTTPTGTLLEAFLATTPANGDCIICYLINTADGAEAITLAGGEGVTISNVGQTLAQNESAMLLFRRTGANTYTCYILGA